MLFGGSCICLHACLELLTFIIYQKGGASNDKPMALQSTVVKIGNFGSNESSQTVSAPTILAQCEGRAASRHCALKELADRLTTAFRDDDVRGYRTQPPKLTFSEIPTCITPGLDIQIQSDNKSHPLNGGLSHLATTQVKGDSVL